MSPGASAVGLVLVLLQGSTPELHRGVHKELSQSSDSHSDSDISEPKLSARLRPAELLGAYVMAVTRRPDGSLQGGGVNQLLKSWS
ncbi:hypothetical protein NDU88_004930 [Pleurodeles waltl]|uniref:Uncharacterized protein n=1 Tax=Pleurodeles waltl TaxID=8319 RepID=A0AAV7L3C5_PLEWA|nr:hypothetical protein NDU88_004930 [Pleurodeles waltl]